MITPEIALSVVHLTKRYGKQTVIADLTLTVRHGDRLTLFAPSGAGKTTLIQILAGLDRAYEGSFMLAARNPVTIFQEPRLFPYMTVEENIFLPAAVRKMPITRQLREQVDCWLAVCDLIAYARHYPHQLSGGMKQKTALIRGFLGEPDFVMMDEPFKSIDVQSKRSIIHHILKTYPQCTTLFVTHSLDEIALFARSLLVFKNGCLGAYTQYDASQLNLGLADIFPAM